MTLPAAPLTLDRLNAMPADAFAAALGEIFEYGTWIAQTAADGRPFATVTALHEAMMAALRAAPQDRQLGFLRGHPELGSKVARKGERADLTDASRAEQGLLGLDRLSDEEFARFEQLNADYRKRFAFPFIICVRRHTRDSILARFAQRLGNDAAAEFAAATEEIGHITRLRLVGMVDGPGKPQTEGWLSTHVLDTAHGRPAEGVCVALYEVGASARGLIARGVTDADGRTPAPLMAGGPLRIGTYELQFSVGDYFARLAPAGAGEVFLDVVPVRFAIAEPEAHYHVPLLVTPWSYATYRGS
jgi:2-oxo-4-hydroxy-4-carboxy-5-ureidoimidazoline decarboxylase